MDESLTIIDGSLYDFLDLVAMNKVHTNPHPASKFTGFLYRLLRRLHHFNTTHKAKQNVAHHYDLSRQLYDLFLDDNRQYSCAYFPSGEEDLDTAQLKKIN